MLQLISFDPVHPYQYQVRMRAFSTTLRYRKIWAFVDWTCPPFLKPLAIEVLVCLINFFPGFIAQTSDQFYTMTLSTHNVKYSGGNLCKSLKKIKTFPRIYPKSSLPRKKLTQRNLKTWKLNGFSQNPLIILWKVMAGILSSMQIYGALYIRKMH